MIRTIKQQGVKRSSDHVTEWMAQPITFPSISPNDYKDGPIVVSGIVAGHKTHRIYVDGGSATEIMYLQCFQLLAEESQQKLIPDSMPLISFSGEIVQPVGQLSLPVTFN